MRSIHFTRTITGLSILCGLLLSAPAGAYPHRGEHMDRAQPDGSHVDVVLWGDEFYVRAETPNGYTLIVDPKTKYICYALATADGNLVSSGVVYDGIMSDAQLAALGITAGARHSSAVRDALAAEKRARLGVETGTVAVRSNADGSYQFDVIAQAVIPAATGATTGLVILVDFPDRKGTISTTEVDNAFNSTSAYGSTWHGSIRNWSEQISGGITSIQHKVAGYYTAKYDVAHYNAPTAEWDYSTSDELYKEIYAYIDANVDLTSYAVNGTLPSLAVAYAGAVIAQGWAMALWPHGGCGGNGFRTSEGVRINQCFMTNLGTAVPLSDLKTFRHELGHSFLHWPDTYDYDDDSESSGGFATETDIPCAPFRMWAGWITPINVTNGPGVYSLAANGDSFLRYNNSSNAKEYFVAEYAKKAARRSPPDEGLLVWHIDENGDNSWQDMTAARHYEMSVEQADGLFQLEKNVRAGAGDLFHADYKDRFDDTTTPNSNWWNGSSSGFKLCNIGGITADTMTVNAGCVTAGGASSTGGAPGTGGAFSSGGSRTTGGASTMGSRTGGASSTGGRASSGGVSNTGGVVSSTGGRSSTGGTKNAGGTPTTGGSQAAGGSSNAGGMSAVVVATGGVLATGGSRASTGGTPSTGGTSSTAGTTAVGSSAPVAGSTATSPVDSTGGTTVAAGGSSAVAVVTGGSAEQPGGCSCRTAGRVNGTGWASVSLLGLLGFAWRRRQRNR